LRGVVVTSGGVDLVAVGVAAAVLMLVGLCASLPAARRAARTDPLIALRAD
jgi:ABC-type antimicrobial peptide transport system permease subunit